jgi:hypothetical protein
MHLFVVLSPLVLCWFQYFPVKYRENKKEKEVVFVVGAHLLVDDAL